MVLILGIQGIPNNLPIPKASPFNANPSEKGLEESSLSRTKLDDWLPREADPWIRGGNLWGMILGDSSV